MSHHCGAFADFDFYADVFGGSRVSEKDFSRSAMTASALIERETLGRALLHLDDTRLKMCCCALAEAVFDCAASGGFLKKSESVGAWSYSLSDAPVTLRCSRPLSCFVDATCLPIGFTEVLLENDRFE